MAIRNPTALWFRRLALPLLLGLGLAGAWSAYWLVVRAQIQDEVGREVAHLQAQGGDFECADLRWGGFPLRIAMSCGRTILALPGGLAIETARLEAAAHLHHLRYIVTIADGPTRIRLDTGETLALDHTPARIGLLVPADGLPQATLEAERIAVESDLGWSFRGRNVALAAASETPDRLEFSASGETLNLAAGVMPTVALDVLEVEGWVEGLPAAPPRDLRALLREAAQLRSRVTVESFRIEMDGIELTASGTVEFGPEGPTGSLATTVTNYREFLADLEQRGVVSRRAVRASTAVIGLLQGGRRREQGEVKVALRFHEGQVFWGPFLIAEFPPLQ